MGKALGRPCPRAYFSRLPSSSTHHAEIQAGQEAAQHQQWVAGCAGRLRPPCSRRACPPPPVGGEMMTLDFGNITRLIMLNSESKLVLDNLNITGKSLLPAAGQQRPGLAGAFRSVWASPARQAAPHHPLVPTRSLMVQRAVPPPPPPPPPAVCLQGRGPRRLACSPGRGRSTAPRCGPPSMANPATRWVCTPAALEASCCRFHWGVVDAPRGPGGAARSHLGRGSLRTAAMTC